MKGAAGGARNAAPIAVRIGWTLIAGILLMTPLAAGAQLRPLDPIPWRLLEPTTTVAGQIGFGTFAEQRASLAGTVGTLHELGNFAIGWRTGRVGLEISGTMARRFQDDRTFRPPRLGAHAPPEDGRRSDSGDVRVATLVRLVGDGEPRMVALRFGTRLPTTSDEHGLDRDRTDFYATVAGRADLGPMVLSGEGGVSINGTRLPDYDQTDVWTYSASLEYAVGPVTAIASLVGHENGHDWVVTGSEEMREVRLGVRAGGRRWVELSWVRGFETFSPERGVLVAVGFVGW